MRECCVLGLNPVTTCLFVRTACVALMGYLIGAIPTSYLYGKLFRRMDIRKHGSGNVGAANTFRVLGPLAGIIVLIVDAGKGWLAAGIVGKHLAPDPGPAWLAIVAGLAAIAGHNWTPFLKFRGGRGVATSAGVFLALEPRALGLALAVWIAAVAITRIISVGSIAGAISLPLFLRLFEASTPVFAFGIVAAALVIIRHIPNLKRLVGGTENRIRFRRGRIHATR